jgi:hypothetical protein
MMRQTLIPIALIVVLGLGACSSGFRGATDHRRQIELSDESFASPGDCRDSYVRSILDLNAASGSCGYAPK